MGPGAARTTVEWPLPDSPFEDLAAGRRRLLFPSRVSPQVVQTIQVKAFLILLRPKAACSEVTPECLLVLEARAPCLVLFLPHKRHAGCHRCGHTARSANMPSRCLIAFSESCSSIFIGITTGRSLSTYAPRLIASFSVVTKMEPGRPIRTAVRRCTSTAV